MKDHHNSPGYQGRYGGKSRGALSKAGKTAILLYIYKGISPSRRRPPGYLLLRCRFRNANNATLLPDCG
jgi:hypothetical protein